VEDPIEYMHRHLKSTINQRELGADVPTFALALRAALRQAPKVILVGEMRDLETMEIAMEAAETGHLVLSTLHTIDASKSVARIIGAFPKGEEQQIRNRLSATFKWIVSQRLVPKADGSGRLAVCEILRSNQRTREYIQKGEAEGRSLLDAMNDGSIDGMQTFDMELERLWCEGVITKDTALSYATNTPNLALRMSGIGDGGPKEAAPEEPPELFPPKEQAQPEQKAKASPVDAQPAHKGGAKKAEPQAPPSEASFVDIKDLME
jgi:twitching motility protein PilT